MSLFHYTDAAAVKSILENRSLWFTDIRFLNDSQEFHDGIKFITESAYGPVSSLWFNHDYLDQARDAVRKTIEENIDFSLSESPLFVCSFTRAQDLLSQWRGYGMYAIEFSEEALGNYLPTTRTCVYGIQEKGSTSQDIIRSALEVITNDLAKNDGRMGTKSMDALSEIALIASIFKNGGFHEEREVRSIEYTHAGDERIKFRSKLDLLIPYIEVKIDLDCIKAIHIGPIRNKELAQLSLDQLIRKELMEYRADGGNVETEIQIIQTSLPYRSM
jgi:hypothetical protein